MTSLPSQIDPVTLGARLKSARETAGLTQNQVADELSIARTTVVAIEKGERRVKPTELVALASFMGRVWAGWCVLPH
jgi:DNA-binding XRE family transcriptional regulator